jgi:hypothetical protein
MGWGAARVADVLPGLFAALLFAPSSTLPRNGD